MSIDTATIHAALGEFFQRLFGYVPLGITIVVLPFGFRIAFTLADKIMRKVVGAFGFSPD